MVDSKNQSIPSLMPMIVFLILFVIGTTSLESVTQTLRTGAEWGIFSFILPLGLLILSVLLMIRIIYWIEKGAGKVKKPIGMLEVGMPDFDEKGPAP